MNIYANTAALSVAHAEPDVRATFIRKTYTHLAGAIGLFVLLEMALLQSPFAPAMMKLLAGSRYSWLMVLGGFALFGMMARKLASSGKSSTMQYVGLGAYVVAEAIIFVPILFIARFYSSPEVLPNAAIMTGCLFAALTGIAFTTRKDFSFLRGIIGIGGMMAMGAIVCGVIFGFTLGLFFSVIMLCVASAAILYDTSKIIHHYPTDRHVAASLELFASVALMFWYVLRILMSLNRR
ncbi:MAG: Bax inhibitor-1 family protein [Phycisphaeraceae bacterium]|nr:Bax inhibitor-1 family protein [Phycisphaeraceae bacterium]